MAASAADLTQPGTASTASAPSVRSTPSFSVTAYIWATAIDGRSATFPPLPAVDIDLRFRDILQELNGAMMASADMRTGRWSFLVDGQFSQITSVSDLSGPYSSSLKIRSRSLTVQTAAFYRVYDDPGVSLDVGGGVRLWMLENELKLLTAIPNVHVDRRHSEVWVDPIVGTRLGMKLDGPWSLTLAGDIGGFGLGSDLTWQALGGLNYAWRENVTLKAGYRALHVDYRDGGFLYDTTMQGPVLAASYRF